MQEPICDAAAVLDRLALLHETKTDSALAACLGVARGTLSSWRARGAVPPGDCVIAAKRSNISLEWLINGRGPRSLDDLNGDGAAEIADPYRRYLAREYSLITKGGVKLSPETGEVLPFPRNAFPVSFKSKYLANLAGDLDGPCYGYLANDDRMEPTIKNGWCVLVHDTDNEIDEPGVYGIVFLDTGEQTFRRVTPAGDTLHLHCDNPAYPSMTLDISRRSCPISVLGRAVWCGGFLG